MIYYADTSQNVQNELHQLAQHLHLPLPSLFTRIICMFIACIYSNYASADARNFKRAATRVNATVNQTLNAKPRERFVFLGAATTNLQGHLTF